MEILPWKLLLAVEASAPPAEARQGLARLDEMGRMRLAVASSLLIIVICALLLIVAYLGRVFRRRVGGALPPSKPEEHDAWARKPLARLDDENDDEDDGE